MCGGAKGDRRRGESEKGGEGKEKEGRWEMKKGRREGKEEEGREKMKERRREDEGKKKEEVTGILIATGFTLMAGSCSAFSRMHSTRFSSSLQEMV